MTVKSHNVCTSKHLLETKLEAVRQRIYGELSYQAILDRYGISSIICGHKIFHQQDFRIDPKLAQWYNRVEKMGMANFRTVIETMQNNYLSVLNYFERRSTNASAESFNAKIKAFRTQFSGVKDMAFFMFRLTKIYA